MLKTLDQFDWNWPTKINRLLIQNLFHLDFVAKQRQRHLHFRHRSGQEPSDDRARPRRLPARALGAVHRRHRHHQHPGRRAGRGGIKQALNHYVKPRVLCIDEFGYLPIDKFGADCLFQIISHRYERGATLVTTNRIYKHWASIFNNDAVLTSALLDRLLHHAETVLIEGKSYRSKDQVEI